MQTPSYDVTFGLCLVEQGMELQGQVAPGCCNVSQAAACADWNVCTVVSDTGGLFLQQRLLGSRCNQWHALCCQTVTVYPAASVLDAMCFIVLYGLVNCFGHRGTGVLPHTGHAGLLKLPG
jgi:hypothetical protein